MNAEDASPKINISEVKIRLLDEPKEGLIGWASCVVNGALFLNNIAIRCSREGKLVLSFPAKRSKRDTKYFYFNPISHEAMQILKKAIKAIIDKLDLAVANKKG